MAFRRKFLRRRRPVRRPLRRRRTSFRRRRLHRRSNRVVHFKRTVLLESFSVIGTELLRAYTIRLSQLTNVSEFTNLFQAYRINKAYFRIVPGQNICVAGAITNGTPVIVDAIDYNDATGSSSTQLLEFSNHRIHRGIGEVHRKLTPAVNAGIQGGGAGIVGGSQRFKQWIDATIPDAAHFGYKLAVTPDTGSATSYDYRVYMTLYFSLKQLY